MDIEFDSAKDRANIAKHGISLARAGEMDVVQYLRDGRFAAEPRYRAWGLIDGKTYCLAYTFRGGRVRAISLRRAHKKEMKRHAP